MIHSLEGYPLIAGFRHAAARDEAALVGVIRGAGSHVPRTSRDREFDINPVILYEQGGCAVDARIYTDESVRAGIDVPGRGTCPQPC